MPDTGDRVRTIVSSVLRVPVETVDVAASPDTIASWDSLNHMQLILALEEEFGVQFSVDDMDAMQSVGGIVAVLTQCGR